MRRFEVRFAIVHLQTPVARDCQEAVYTSVASTVFQFRMVPLRLMCVYPFLFRHNHTIMSQQ